MTSPLPGEGHDSFKITQPAPALPRSPELLTTSVLRIMRWALRTLTPPLSALASRAMKNELGGDRGGRVWLGAPCSSYRKFLGLGRSREQNGLSSPWLPCLDASARQQEAPALWGHSAWEDVSPSRLGLGALNGQLGELVCVLASAVHWDSWFS